MNNKIRLLIISYYFPPSGGGGIQRIVKFLKYLDYSKFKATVLTSSEAGLNVKDASLENEIPSEVNIIRIPHKPPHVYMEKLSGKEKDIYETSFLKRYLGAFFFIPDTRKSWIKNVIQYVQDNKEQFMHQFDLILGSVPPYSIALIAQKLSKYLLVPYVLDYRDGWLYHPFQIFPTPIHFYVHKNLEKNVLEKAKGVITTSSTLLKKMKHQYPILNKKNIITIYNGFDSQDISFAEKHSLKSINDKILIGLPGTTYFTATRPVNLLKALKNNVSNNFRDKTLSFQIMGKWTKQIEKFIKKYELENYFQFKKYLSHPMYLEEVQKMHANFLFLENVKNIEYVIPGRFYELMYLRRPLIVFGPPAHEILILKEKFQFPFLYLENNVNNILKVLTDLENVLSELNKKIQSFDYKKMELDFDRKQETLLLMEFLKKCI